MTKVILIGIAVVFVVGCKTPVYESFPAVYPYVEFDWTETRSYLVSGEVKQPGLQPYLGKTDVRAAILAAQGFTDDADRKRVKVIRKEGSVEHINYVEIMQNGEEFPRIFPGDSVDDQIKVRK